MPVGEEGRCRRRASDAQAQSHNTLPLRTLAQNDKPTGFTVTLSSSKSDGVGVGMAVGNVDVTVLAVTGVWEGCA